MADSLEGSASEDELRLANHDFDKLVSACENVGYSDGVVAGEDTALQNGFNDGFVQGFHQSLKVARIKGIASALQAYKCIDNVQSKCSPDIVSNLEKLLTQIADVEATTVQDTPNTRLRLKESKPHDTNMLNTTQEECNQSNCCQKLDHAMQESDGDFTDENAKGRCDNCKESSRKNENSFTKKLENTRSEDAAAGDSYNINEALTNILGELMQSLRDHDVQIGSNTMLDHIINNYKKITYE